MLGREALVGLRRLAATGDLPADTLERVARACLLLADFPQMGRSLGRRDGDVRVLVGPWDWLLVIYEWFSDAELVVIVGIHDARAADAPQPA